MSQSFQFIDINEIFDKMIKRKKPFFRNLKTKIRATFYLHCMFVHLPQ